MRLYLFVKLKYDTSTIILFVGIRYAMRDLLSDLCSRLTELWRYINFVLLLLLLITMSYYIEKNCIQSIQCCISRRSKTAEIKCYKLLA